MKLLGATTVLSTLLVTKAGVSASASASASALPKTKRLRTKSIYKSSSSRNSNSNPKEATSHRINEDTKPTMKMCSFCQDGVTAPDGFVIPDAEGATCGQAALYARTIQEDDSLFSAGECTQLKQAEILCCPAEPRVPCGFCANDDAAGESSVVVPDSNGATCGLTYAYAKSLEGDAEECRAILMAEGVCCPDFDVACSFCPGGLAVDPEYVLPDEEGTTCGTVLGYAPTISAEDEMCPTVQFAEMFCCPAVDIDVDVDVVIPEEDVVMSMNAIVSMSMSMSMSMMSMESTVVTTIEPTEPPAKSDPITSPDGELSSAPAPADPIPSPDPDGSAGSPTQRPVETPIPPAAPSPRLAPSSAVASGTSSLLFALMSSATIAGLNLL